MITPKLLTPILLTTALGPWAAMAQRSGIGVKGGPLLSETRSGAIATKPLIGASAGLYFPLRAGQRFELQPELLVTSLGAAYTMPDDDRAIVRNVYVQIPLSAKLFFTNSLNVQGGFQMGYLIWAKQTVDGESSDVKESYENMDLGLVLGAGVDLVSGVDFGLRYYNGLKPILLNDDVYYPRNQAYMLSIGYRFSHLKAPKFNRRRH